jgi:hypothetical protein
VVFKKASVKTRRKLHLVRPAEGAHQGHKITG